MPFGYMASPPFEIDPSEAGSTCGDNSEYQDYDITSLLPSKSEDPGQDSDVEIVKSRPQRSPYASDIIALRFSPSQTLRIPRQFIEETPLAARLLRCHPPNEIDLGSIQFEAGHVIVNFLVTGKYQCLEPWGTTAAGKNSSEFRTALRVYMAAESFCLVELFNVAQAEVKKVGDRLSFPQVVDNVHFLNPFHAHFPWIGEYIQSRMVSFWENTTIEQATEMTSDVPGPSNLHKILINGLLKMKASSSWPRGCESTIRDAEGPEDPGEEDLIFPRPLVEKLRAANERMLKLAADLKTAGVLKSGSGNSSKQPERLVQQPEFTLLHETPDLPPKKSVKEVEQQAVLEQSELRSLKSKIIGREKAGLELSWVDHRRAELLEQKSQRRSDVVNAKIDWDRIDSQQDKAEAAVKSAISIGKWSRFKE
ncbi:hypothetical protein Neosp_007717 [[Neocosmospora] mangrovei]